MADKNGELLARLLATFRLEADEHVRAMSSGLLALEKLSEDDSRRAEIIETIFRQAHSLKGAARSVKLSQIEAVCQSLEGVFAALRDGEMSLSTSLADLLHRSVSLVEALAGSDPDEARQRQAEVTALVRQLDRSLGRAHSRGPARGGPTQPEARSSSPPVAADSSTLVAPPSKSPISVPGSAATVRIATKKLDAVMRLSEELLSSRLSATQRAMDIRRALDELQSWRKRSMEMQALVRPLERGIASSPVGTAGNLRKLLDHLAEEQVRVHALEDQLVTIGREADRDRRALTSMTEGLQVRVREMQLLPCATLLDVFARQARELARDQDKMVELTVRGNDIEVDRRLLDEIKDPLIHLVRNCIDHGIEKPPERQKLRKPAQGHIAISVTQKDSGKIALTVTDDGKGIDTERLKAVALEQAMLREEVAESLQHSDALNLIFRSGLSTSALITDVSGRGLGLAIVRDKIEQLGGTIEVTSTPNLGTEFQMVLPVSLTTFRGTLVSLSGRAFILPSTNVDRAVRLAAEDIHTVNNCDTVAVDDQALPLVSLHDILGVPRHATDTDDSPLAVVLGRGANRTAFRVDAVIGEQEVLVKGLGPQLRRVRNVTGASVLGNGQVVPVLKVPDLLEAALRQPVRAAGITPARPDQAQRSILVAEDSITSRALMKNILESAGFRVVTAVDGIDAFTSLKMQSFDLLVSDVDMPRLNGFDLTAKLRADAQLNELPVILVTTLDSREDRERGVDVGANAYIVKSSFDQSNLLEVIQRLI